MGFLAALVVLTLVKVVLSRQGTGSWLIKKMQEPLKTRAAVRPGPFTASGASDYRYWQMQNS